MKKIENELIIMFDDMLKQLPGFNRKTYEDKFKDAYAKYAGVMADITEACEGLSGEELDAKIDAISSILPLYAKEKLSKLKKSQKDRKEVDYNMTMVVYILPMIAYARETYCFRVSERIVEIWNQEKVSSLTLSSSTFEQINGGFKKGPLGLCFITTAVCDHLGKPDDCYELNTLRKYRDSYLLSSDEGTALVEEYYDRAPFLVQVMNMQEDAHAIYKGIYEEYLLPCIKMIENNENEACKNLYRSMVDTLENRYYS